MELHLWMVLVQIMTLEVIWGKIGFKKDLDMNVEFPPTIIRHRNENIPAGHLRPLGWQRRPEGKITEEKEMLKPQKFYSRFVKSKKPVVFRGVADEVPAMEQWKKDSSLDKKYGQLDVMVTVKNSMLKSAKPNKLKLKKFLREYEYENWYLATTTPHEMMHELLLPKCLRCSTMRKNLAESEIWMSSGGTSSTLHYHADHDMHCILDGRKDFILIHPKYKSDITFVEQSPHSGSGYSTVDVDMVNAFKDSKLAATPWHYTTLLAGDCIFIPADYPHQVRSYGRSISYTVLWSPTPKVDIKDCNEEVENKLTLLTDASFMWTFADGDKLLFNSRLNPESTRRHLLGLMRTDGELYYDRFHIFYNESLSEVRDAPGSSEVFKSLDPNNQGFITREAVEKLDNMRLQELADVLNRAHAHSHRHDEL